MSSVVRASCLWVAVCAAAFAIAGCDTGGLLVVEHKRGQGPSVNDLVNNGTYATNGKYRVFYTFGQATPNQGVSTSSQKTLNGGLVGAAHSD